MGDDGPRWLVSACLLGRACRYDGASKHHQAVEQAVAEARARGIDVVAVCPEQAGGLGTPRPAADLRGGDGHAVLDGHATARTVTGDHDVTDGFLRGAMACDQPADRAILKARSPSCGTGTVWIDGALAPGDGVFAARLRRRGVMLASEEDVQRTDDDR